MSFTAAIIGRPNVGKSTLFNRLIGKRLALVDDMPGVTRDRREGKAHLADLEFTVVDTAGLEDAKPETLQARMTAQTLQGVEEADVVMLVVDGRAGITPGDEHFAKLVRKLKRPVVLVINKAEGSKADSTIADSYRLGFGEPAIISAEHGEGMAELYDALVKFAPKSDKEEFEGKKKKGRREKKMEAGPLQLAIVGRPNVGKSTLLNKILGEERTLTGPEAGITRDSIMVDYTFEGRQLRLVDTAGMRRRANVDGKIEKLAVADSLHAVQYAHVVVLVLDANQPLEKQDNTIAALIEQEGRAMVIAVNKWDSIDDKSAYIKAIHDRLEKVLPQMKGIPVVPISGMTGHNIPKLLKECFRVYDLWNTEIGTGELNRWLSAAIEEYTPPLISGRRIKIRYMTQKASRPPTFILFSNLSDVPESYLRYLVNSMRVRFDLPAVPIRLRVRVTKNPYAEKDE